MDDIRQLSTRDIYANPWLRLREDQVRFADGSVGTYAVVQRQDFVAVVAVENGGLWLVQQFRYPLGRRLWELPQGAWSHGRSGTALELAQAELLEETGLTAEGWQHLGRIAANPALSPQHYDVFVATDLTPGDPQREASESDMVHAWFPEDEVRAMIVRGDIMDSHSIAAFAVYDLHRR